MFVLLPHLLAGPAIGSGETFPKHCLHWSSSGALSSGWVDVVAFCHNLTLAHFCAQAADLCRLAGVQRALVNSSEL